MYSGSTGSWTLDKHLKFVYDGYEQIEELDALNSNAIAKKHIWSNGKIIAEIHSTPAGATRYYALGDANKNITEYVDSSGTIQAHYEYSPFGEVSTSWLSSSLSSAGEQNPFAFKFSSEYFDTETNLVYYNYRYYSPNLGRWFSRDSIEEGGGYNLYGMVSNEVIDIWDILGLNGSIAIPKWLPISITRPIIPPYSPPLYPPIPPMPIPDVQHDIVPDTLPDTIESNCTEICKGRG